MSKSVTIIPTIFTTTIREPIKCDSCIDTSETIKTLFNIPMHSSAVGKICNGHLPQRAEFMLMWTDAASKTIQHGHCREVLSTNGDDHFSMQKAAKSYDTSVTTIRKACEEGRLVKCKGELISLHYRKDAHLHIEEYIVRLQKARAEIEELRRTNAELTQRLEKANKPEVVKIKIKPHRKGVR